MNWYPAKPDCACTADITQTSAVLNRYRHGRKDRAKKVRHFRSADQAHFWHWSDDAVVDAPVGDGGEWVDYRDPDAALVGVR